jgi:hypothetical protein
VALTREQRSGSNVATAPIGAEEKTERNSVALASEDIRELGGTWRVRRRPNGIDIKIYIAISMI